MKLWKIESNVTINNKKGLAINTGWVIAIKKAIKRITGIKQALNVNICSTKYLSFLKLFFSAKDLVAEIENPNSWITKNTIPIDWAKPISPMNVGPKILAKKGTKNSRSIESKKLEK